MSKRIALLGLVLAIGCRGGLPPQSDGGPSCGTNSCAQGQVCCIDCNGYGRCGAPETTCTNPTCTGDGGVNCGATRCSAAEVCCIDCNEKASCTPQGTACTGTSCSCGPGSNCCGTAPGSACCYVGSGCTPGLRCCVGGTYPSGGTCEASCVP